MTHLVYVCDLCGKSQTQPRKAPRPDRAGYRIPASLCREFDYLNAKHGDRAMMQADSSLDITEIPNNQVAKFTREFLVELLLHPKNGVEVEIFGIKLNEKQY